MSEPGSQLSVLQRVRNKNNIADMLYRRKVDQIERETTMAMSKIEMEKLDCKSFLKTLRSCDSDDMSEFAPLMSYTLREELGSAMRGRRTRFRDLFTTNEFSDRLPVVLDYRNIKSSGEKHRYKDLKRSRTLTELWTSKLNSYTGVPTLQRAQTDIPLDVASDQNNKQQEQQEGTVNLSAGIITKMVDKNENKGTSAFKKLPTPRSSFSHTLPTIKNKSNEINSSNQESGDAKQDETAFPKLQTASNEHHNNQTHDNLVDQQKVLHHQKKDTHHSKVKKLALEKKIEHFYQDIETLVPKKEEQQDWLLPPLNSS